MGDQEMLVGRAGRDILAALCSAPAKIRNICILAHVDHGKTTIVDLLLTTNMIISRRSAGQLRYMDDREDEQRRGITMKSSAISLWYRPSADVEYLVNVVDSPGHIDFDAEVVAAVRMSDGAVIVLDVVEGVCSQTRSAVRHAISEGTAMVLVLNKVDRLLVELRFTPKDASLHLIQMVDSMNALVAEIQGAVLDTKDNRTECYFDPLIRNVVFASATDGWGFTLYDISYHFARTLQIDRNAVLPHLWGDFYYQSKTKSFHTGALEQGKTTAFSNVVKLVHGIYELVQVRMKREILPGICSTLGVQITREMNHSDPKVQVKAIMSTWMPLPQGLLGAVARNIQSPAEISQEKVCRMLSCGPISRPELSEVRQSMETALRTDLSEPTIVYVSKIMCVDKRTLPENRMKMHLASSDEPEFIACARVFSGCVTPGMEMHHLMASHEPGNPKATSLTLGSLYLIMGRELIPLEQAKKGAIIGIGGVSASIHRTGTLSTSVDCLPLYTDDDGAEKLFRTAVEPLRTSDLPALETGLKALAQADCSVQVKHLNTGEYVLYTDGPVHLQKCIVDLQKFASIEVSYSEPMVVLKETIKGSASGTAVFAEHGVHLDLTVTRIPEELLCVLEHHRAVLLAWERASSTSRTHLEDLYGRFLEEIRAAADKLGPDWAGARVLSVSGASNLLLSLTDATVQSLESSVRAGFKLAVSSGPLCSEPLFGVAVVGTSWRSEGADGEVNAAFYGKYVSTMSAAIKECLGRVEQLLLEPFHHASIVADLEALGAVYVELNKHHGKVVTTDTTNSGRYEIAALVPVIESANFGSGLRSVTTGKAHASFGATSFEVVEEEGRSAKLASEVRSRKGLSTNEPLVRGAEKQPTARKK